MNKPHLRGHKHQIDVENNPPTPLHQQNRAGLTHPLRWLLPKPYGYLALMPRFWGDLYFSFAAREIQTDIALHRHKYCPARNYALVKQRILIGVARLQRAACRLAASNALPNGSGPICAKCGLSHKQSAAIRSIYPNRRGSV